MSEEEMVAAVRERDRRIAALIDEICRRAGGENEDPTVMFVEDACKRHGLWITAGEMPDEPKVTP